MLNHYKEYLARLEEAAKPGTTLAHALRPYSDGEPLEIPAAWAIGQWWYTNRWFSFRPV